MQHHHYILYKPNGYLSQFVYQKKRAKKLLGELYHFAENTMAIGRLDEDSEGLLLLTTNGMISEEIRSKKVEKEYFAQVDGIITPDALKQLEEGVVIGVKGTKYKTLPCVAKSLIDLPITIGDGKKIRDDRHGPTSWLRIIVTEGKYRQVRKMTAAVGFPTLRLIRYRIGTITLEQLQCGDVVEVQKLEY